ncbi:MAG: hypothetical protein ABWX96_22785 [Propionibacteriaceae bacterium]
MTPKKLTTRPADAAWARGRRDVGRKYLEIAELVESEDGESVNVCVGLAVLAGIAAGDAICASALGESYSGTDHATAASLLERVDRDLGRKLRSLVALKPGAHYGNALLTSEQRRHALRSARALVDAAQVVTT